MRSILLSIGYEPIDILPWFDAFTLLWEDKATMHWSYPERRIRSARESWDWPSIISMKYYVRRKPEKEIMPSTKAILIRDMYVCQYCGERLTNSNGTKDHVIPIAKGGKGTWSNLVASCRKCQEDKADKLPHECGMHPITKPHVPCGLDRFKSAFMCANAYEKKNWKLGMKSLGLEKYIEGASRD